MNDIARESLLYDFYGNLLTDKKRGVMECYHEDDMSLGEIADEMGISRAAVHDSLKSAEAQLEQYEEKLGLLEKYEKAGALADEADAIIKSLERTMLEDAGSERIASGGAGSESKISGADGAAASKSDGMMDDMTEKASGAGGKEKSDAGADLKRLRDIIAALVEPGS